MDRAATGIVGLDGMMHGGLPRGSVTLVEGAAGTGKTLLALQSLSHAAKHLDEPGIFVAFEENSARVVANAAQFGWDIPSVLDKRLFIIDAQPSYDLVQSGGFDLGGLLAALATKIQQTRARRVVFDALDVVLSMLDDPAATRRELYRLRDWIAANNLTAVITAKVGMNEETDRNRDFMQFMVDCAVRLERVVNQGIVQRNLRIVKYRGSSFEENQAPYVIGNSGLEVANIGTATPFSKLATSERLSSGVARLDTMLGGGFFRGAGILLTGAPGTAKTTLSGAFAEAACQRGERTLYVSFDSDASEVVRNLRSVGIRLDRYVANGKRPGLLDVIYARALEGNAESHLLQIQARARMHRALCLVIDPISALAQHGNKEAAQSVAKRLIDWTKLEGITSFCTSLLEDGALDVEASPLQISTIADTWIHLSYIVRSGERNRCLSIIKSRGTAHSNQVRELLLSDSGITLADTYALDGDVLMGTQRWEREQALRAAQHETTMREEATRLKLVTEEAGIAVQLAAISRELKAKRAELKALRELNMGRQEAAHRLQLERMSLRGDDLAVMKEGASRPRE